MCRPSGEMRNTSTTLSLPSPLSPRALVNSRHTQPSSSTFDCTSPKVENTRSTLALDATAVSSDLHKSSMSSFRWSACDCHHVWEDWLKLLQKHVRNCNISCLTHNLWPTIVKRDLKVSGGWVLHQHTLGPPRIHRHLWRLGSYQIHKSEKITMSILIKILANVC